MEYNEAYQRNVGLFSTVEQALLKASKVTIAGQGGVGGIQAITLARMGIGSMVIIDPGSFDPPDMNRQYGALNSTMGRNKARVMEALLHDVNPFMEIEAYSTPVLGQSQLEKLMAGSSLVIDAIDSAAYNQKVVFAKAARNLQLYNLCAPIHDFGISLKIYHPDGMTFEEFCPYSSAMAEPLPSNAAVATLSGAILALEAALIICGRKKDQNIYRVPDVICIDMLTGKREIFNPFA
jgi:molybdopterin/thiamine biosynthesis adenylyltransferase